ncbi:MAG: hypothetical protein FD165_1162 [Gammaproteobacteria bacterium]|nr:MAG: hypothetical protein FD165_1162 [Gammaproteobacteria bacterium]TND07321.1 MAG: hypothetical protein FD120_59 [Gammaproteobacteria bacterium]
MVQGQNTSTSTNMRQRSMPGTRLAPLLTATKRGVMAMIKSYGLK